LPREGATAFEPDGSLLFYPGFRHLLEVPDCTGADLLFRLSMRSPKTKCITLCRMAQILGLAGIIDSICVTLTSSTSRHWLSGNWQSGRAPDHRPRSSRPSCR